MINIAYTMTNDAIEMNTNEPYRASKGAAGFDLYNVYGTVIGARTCQDKPQLVGTGVRLEIPEGWMGLILDRSGIVTSYGAFIVGGVIDSDYRGEIKVAFCNLAPNPVFLLRNQRIAQIVFYPCFIGDLVRKASLSQTVRAERGFGSTGTN